MSSQRFSLKPFVSPGITGSLEITGTIGLRSNTLAISYTLVGPLSELVIPEPTAAPVRKQSLWEETCFEFFLAPLDSDQYWEFNLSPSGHWNIYSFKTYRQGMREETAFASLPFVVSKQTDSLQLFLEADLQGIIQTGGTLQAGVSTVVKSRNGEMTYWALTHSGQQADFHRRDGFLLELCD